MTVDNAPAKFDELDVRILDALIHNGRESYSALAEKLGVADGTVRLRLQRMLASEIVRLLPSMNPLRLPHSIYALIMIKLGRYNQREVLERLSAIPSVTAVCVVTGGYDLVAEVFVDSLNSLSTLLMEKISRVEGIVSTESLIVLDAVGKWVPLWASRRIQITKLLGNEHTRSASTNAADGSTRHRSRQLHRQK